MALRLPDLRWQTRCAGPDEAFMPSSGLHFDYGKPLVIFCRNMTALIREVGEQPSTPACLLYQDVVQR
ncbi:hypothetical protein KCP75_11800 [Salmonella enterica subsp. enterica]|nr:hypothetical protein KCP75_11800 [Salmonella enterica subsp. enterica]